MERYKNLSGRSGVLGFEIGLDFIRVRFKTGGTYLYTYGSAGTQSIERMKTLAIQGKGLNTYIGRYVKNRYASRSGV